MHLIVLEILTHIRAQSMSTAACVTPLLFRLKAFTVFTPNFSLNLRHNMTHCYLRHHLKTQNTTTEIKQIP